MAHGFCAGDHWLWSGTAGIEAAGRSVGPTGGAENAGCEGTGARAGAAVAGGATGAGAAAAGGVDAGGVATGAGLALGMPTRGVASGVAVEPGSKRGCVVVGELTKDCDPAPYKGAGVCRGW